MKRRVSIFLLGMLGIATLLYTSPASTNTVYAAPPRSNVPIWCILRIIPCDYVQVYNDANNNGVYDGVSENFTTFSSTIATLTIDGVPITLSAAGDEKVKLPPGNHPFSLATGVGWTGSRWSMSGGASTPYTTAVSSFTGSLTVSSGLVSLNLGIRTAGPTSTPVPTPIPTPGGSAAQLRAQGTFFGSGGIVLNRSSAVISTPVEGFTERPDFFVTVNDPVVPVEVRQILSRPGYSWQEVRP